MNEWTIVVLVLMGAFVLYAVHSDRKRKERQAVASAEAEERQSSEEYVIQQQQKFEAEIQHGLEIRLPDALNGREVYIYRTLMREWFAKLTARDRYDEPKVKRLRKDWLVYMEALRHRATNRFLSMESTSEQKQAQYARQVQEETMQIMAIEDAFAEAIGPDAVKTLSQIRAKEYDSFSSSGELAADGYRYLGYSPRGEPEKPIPR